MAEVDKIVGLYFVNRDAMEPVSRSDLLSRMKKGDVQVLDVRPEDEFALAHLPGAINIPLGKLNRKLAGRGPWCILSFEAVALLRAKGFRVRRLEDGLPEWRAAKLPTERS